MIGKQILYRCSQDRAERDTDSLVYVGQPLPQLWGKLLHPLRPPPINDQLPNSYKGVLEMKWCLQKPPYSTDERHRVFTHNLSNTEKKSCVLYPQSPPVNSLMP